MKRWAKIKKTANRLQEKSGVLRPAAGRPEALRQNEAAEEGRPGDSGVFPRNCHGSRLHRRELDGSFLSLTSWLI